jgi:hypothetical protein
VRTDRTLEQRSALLATAHSLAVDGTTAEVAVALRAAGIQSLLLKGPALASWLYDDGSARFYLDSDLLVAPWDLLAARRVLAGLGFEPAPVVGPLPPGGEPHAEPWPRPDGAAVDLHRTLFGAEVPPADVWLALQPLTEPMAVGGATVTILRPPARALVVALHAAQHGSEGAKPLEDLSRAIARLPFETWQGAAMLAARIEATKTLAMGLRLLPQGEAHAERLSLGDPHLVDLALGHDSRAPLALGIERLARTPGIRAKLTLIRREAIPSPAYLRWWSPLARRGPIGLAAAYGARLLWLLRRVGPSFHAWRRRRAAL